MRPSRSSAAAARRPATSPARGRCSLPARGARVAAERTCQGCSPTGLNGRRKVKELQDTTLPGRVQEIAGICGAAIPYEVDWASIAGDAAALRSLDNLSCHRLNRAPRTSCVDAMGKEAVRDGLKLIRLKNVKNKASMRIAFSGGVLAMHCAYALRSGGMFSDGEIRELLLKGL